MKNEKFQLAFELALLDMPEHFSAKQFCRKLREIGTDEAAIKSGAANRFLKSNCIEQSDRGWSKKPAEVQAEIKFQSEDDKQKRIEEAISLLKSEGMRIWKPETKFIEL